MSKKCCVAPAAINVIVVVVADSPSRTVAQSQLKKKNKQFLKMTITPQPTHMR